MKCGDAPLAKTRPNTDDTMLKELRESLIYGLELAKIHLSQNYMRQRGIVNYSGKNIKHLTTDLGKWKNN